MAAKWAKHTATNENLDEYAVEPLMKTTYPARFRTC